jgi:hypothetical protein
MLFQNVSLVRYWRRIIASSSSTVASVVVILASSRPAMRVDTAWEILLRMLAGLSDQGSQSWVSKLRPSRFESPLKAKQLDGAGLVTSFFFPTKSRSLGMNARVCDTHQVNVRVNNIEVVP